MGVFSDESGNAGLHAQAKFLVLRRLQRDRARSRRQQAGAAAASTDAGPASAESGTESEAQ
eukprot:9363989-Lingulodinium_polyedra.AAC.1